MSWVAGIRLATWEKSRLEEIYTAHLLRTTFSDGNVWRDPRIAFNRGRMEGWAQVRIAGQPEWKRVWMVLSSASQEGAAAPKFKDPTRGISKRGISSEQFGGNRSEIRKPIRSSIAFYTTRRGKPQRQAWLTLYNITQAFAVSPERVEMVDESTLIKVEGFMSEEEGAGISRGREGWVLIMPEIKNAGGKKRVLEMIKWIVGQCATRLIFWTNSHSRHGISRCVRVVRSSEGIHLGPT